MSAVSGLLGLACRAGQIALGADIALQEIRAGKAALLLLDAGASEGTKKKLLDACAYRSVPVYTMPEREISSACGRDGRMAAAVRKGNLAARMREILEHEESDPTNSLYD
ncbi:MAG: ribosomal L7Ae/L30e/S12e/Gadd45 family protein [Clostridia bacterium]|nr:ribosomal L7Ae/L30e/S12e/Gadd45 family protein [Clostridia bacterium]